MLWIFFVFVPLLLGTVIAATRDIPRWRWLLLIAVVMCIQIIVLAKPSQSWGSKQTASLWILEVFLPWCVMACVIAFAPYPKRRIFIAIGFPILYFLLLGFGFIVGDISGLIPQ
jgi:hypothetical protein